MCRDEDMRNLPGLYHLEAGHGIEGSEGPSPLIAFVYPQSSWEQLNPQASVSVSSVRTDRVFHPLSAVDNQSRMAVVASPQMRRKVERLGISPGQGLNPVPSLPHFPRWWG